MESKGTKELKEVLDLALTAVDVGVKVAKDGHVSVLDFSAFLELLPVVGPAIDGVGEVKSEVADLDEAEALELAAHVMARLAVDDAKARLIVDKSLKAVFAAVALAQAIKYQEPVAPAVDAPTAEAPAPAAP